MKKFLPLALFVVLVGFLYVGLDLDPKKLPSPLVGKTFPEVMVEDFDTGERYPIHQRFQQKLSLVNVWASWCVTCRAEHDMLLEIAKDQRVQMLGINYKDTKPEAQQFLARLGNPYDAIIFDQQGTLGLELGVYATPETFLVDQQGVIQEKHIGQLTSRVWQQKFKPLIQQLKKTK